MTNKNLKRIKRREEGFSLLLPRLSRFSTVYEMMIKKLLLILCLLSMPAHAEWKEAAESDTSRFYVDYSRIKNEGRYKSMWYLNDYKSPNTDSSGKQYKSAILKRLIDCQGSRSQNVALNRYSEQMGGGENIYSDNRPMLEAQWEYAVPNSVGDSLIKIACATNNNPKPPISNTQDIKRQRCINLGLAPNSADFQQCMK
jgi:hypothetical protein